MRVKHRCHLAALKKVAKPNIVIMGCNAIPIRKRNVKPAKERNKDNQRKEQKSRNQKRKVNEVIFVFSLHPLTAKSQIKN